MCGDTGMSYDEWIPADEVSNIDATLADYDVDLNSLTDGTTTVADTGWEGTNGFDWYSNEQYPTDTAGQTLQTQTGEEFYDDASAREGATDRDSLINSVSSKADDKSLLDKTTDFLNDKKNNELLKLGVGGAQGLYGAYAANKKDKQAREDKREQREYDERLLKLKAELAAGKGGGGGSSALELLAAKDALEQEQNKRYSASITGLKKPGLINGGKKLTYVGGKPVYTDDGKLN